MPILRIAVLSVSVVCAACGGGEKSASTPPPGAAGTTASPPAAALVTPETVANCAGITRDKAAVLLGVPASALADYSRTEGKLRNCLYTVAENRSNTVSFTLSRKDSVKAAEESIASERESISLAQRSIDSVVGGKTKEAAAQTVSAGDDSFFSPVNGALTMRVRNVIAIITSPRDDERRKRVADAIAEGLRP